MKVTLPAAEDLQIRSLTRLIRREREEVGEEEQEQEEEQEEGQKEEEEEVEVWALVVG